MAYVTDEQLFLNVLISEENNPYISSQPSLWNPLPHLTQSAPSSLNQDQLYSVEVCLRLEIRHRISGALAGDAEYIDSWVGRWVDNVN